MTGQCKNCSGSGKCSARSGSGMTGTLLAAVFSKNLMAFHDAVVFTVIIAMMTLLLRY